MGQESTRLRRAEKLVLDRPNAADAVRRRQLKAMQEMEEEITSGKRLPDIPDAPYGVHPRPMHPDTTPYGKEMTALGALQPVMGGDAAWDMILSMMSDSHQQRKARGGK